MKQIILREMYHNIAIRNGGEMPSHTAMEMDTFMKVQMVMMEAIKFMN